MNPRRAKPKQAWLDSDEGRIATLVRQGLLPEKQGERLLREIQEEKLKRNADIKKPIPTDW